MALSTAYLAQAAFKKLFGLAHTEVKTYPLGNEANASQITIVASDIYAETIPATADAVAGRIIACTNATPGQTDSYLTVAQNLTIAPDGSGEGHAYLVTVPAGHGLIGQINPLTGLAYAQGDIVMSIIPKKFGTSWRPILYDTTPTEIPPLSDQDWIIDERGFVIINTASPAPVYLKCWVYVGKTVSDKLTSANTSAIVYVIDGGGTEITDGEKGHLEIPFACTITQVDVLADQSGSIVIDIWKDTYANFPPTDADSITSSTPPTISSATKSQDSTLTSWTKSISAGDILAFNVDSCTTITRCVISIKVTKV